MKKIHIHVHIIHVLMYIVFLLFGIGLLYITIIGSDSYMLKLLPFVLGVGIIVKGFFHVYCDRRLIRVDLEYIFEYLLVNVLSILYIFMLFIGVILMYMGIARLEKYSLILKIAAFLVGMGIILTVLTAIAKDRKENKKERRLYESYSKNLDR